ncbi:protein O-linked-mannose beta-1,2-N-acetylglucosaminyltransferase 1-like [Penaeus monodon]|uniref:protein O-linked-mannose beta-1,2-N-acetylglucosaminyltransferase 1-like n=1 Tax=Penaeus monodon TaxID=6687 RepID=UPI0018A7BE48|nr:protein O-linked-mannose beta-1,2-N-acetylglucosaminyltransferase 1-like [Penaeus monodon]
MIFSSCSLSLIAVFLIITPKLPANAQEASNRLGAGTQQTSAAALVDGMGDHQYEEYPKVVHITVLSSRRHVAITIDGLEIVNVSSHKAEDETKGSGLYFVLLDQYDGHVIMSRVFDLHNFGNNLQVPPVLTALASGRIMIFAMKTEASLNMGNIIRKLLFSLGSTKVHMVPFRDYMVWVATVRGRTWAEAIIDDTPGEDGYYGAPVMVDVAIPLSSLGPCWDVRKGSEAERWSFCRRFGGYGGLCECDRPAPLHYPTLELADSAIDDVPLGIIASTRPQALYRCLLGSAKTTRRFTGSNFVVWMETTRETIALLDLLRVRFHNA